MKISLRTLQNYLQISTAQFKEVANNLHVLGFEVNSITDYTEQQKIVVGQIISWRRHNNASNLVVCDVRVNINNVVQIVCGSEKIRNQQWVIVATVGAVLPGGLKITIKNIRGISSEGMICSLSELDLTDMQQKENDEIYELNNLQLRHQVGDNVLPILGLDDIIVYCEETYNLHNEAGIYQIASRIADEFSLNIYKYSEHPPAQGVIENNFKITNKATDFCQNSGWATINLLEKSVSPDWITNILKRSQIKRISPIVDLTNLVMLELNQPMHAYDRSDISGDEIIFGKLAPCESSTINFINYANVNCTNQYLCYCASNKKVLGLIGIVGATLGSITNKTNKIVIEASSFYAHQVRKAVTDLKIETQASKLFSRTLSENKIRTALERFLFLGEKLNYFRKYSNIMISTPFTTVNTTYSLSLSEIKQVIGINIEKSMVEFILAKQFPISWTSKNNFTVIVPGERLDVANKNDIIAQLLKTRAILARINHNVTQPQTIVKSKNIAKNNDCHYEISKLLVFNNFKEVHLFSLMPIIKNKLNLTVNTNAEVIIIANPISDKYAQFRERLFYSHIEIVIDNWNKHLFQTNFFEINVVYYIGQNGQICREHHLCLTHGAELQQSYKNFRKFNYSLQHLRDQFLKIMSAIAVPVAEISFILQKQHNYWMNQHNFHEIMFRSQVIGFIGEINGDILKNAKKKRHLFVLEVNIKPLINAATEFKSPPQIFPEKRLLRPPTSKIHEHELTFLINSESYHIIIKQAIAIIIDKYPEVWQIHVTDSYVDKQNKNNHSITVRLWFDFEGQRLQRTETEAFLWRIKGHMESIIANY